uniref:NCHI2, HYDROPHOBIN, NCHI2 n=1 Tax=Neurospora crassa TaxID=5141 RepID=UPI0004E0AF64|nr:Chain A, NCHI2, HYDROPHOBIN, NCHI2 [Neurospora crassa]
SPAAMERQVPYTPCSGLYGTAQCCATDVLGVADLDCANPPATLANATHFESTCAAIGQRARCCKDDVTNTGNSFLIINAANCQTPAGL